MIVFGLQSCNSSKPQIPDVVAATLVLYNGLIWTGDSENPSASAIALRNHEIIFIGSDADVLACANSSTEIIDLEGRRVVPGFIDGHVHFLTPAREKMPAANLRNATSEEDFAKRVGGACLKLPKGKWFTGGSWVYENWDNPVYPTRKVLDKYTPDNPVYLVGSAGHIAMVNSRALEIAGVDEKTITPSGGAIIRYPGTNIPTGILKNNAMKLVSSHVKVALLPPIQQYERALKKMKYANSLGITGVDENLDVVSAIALYNKLLANGEMTVRAHIYASIEKLDYWLGAGVATNIGNRFIHFCGLKSQTDGALGSSSAYFFDEYYDSPGNHGLLLEDLSAGGSLEKRTVACVEAGIQPMAHAIGDRAIHEVLDMWERIGGDNCADIRFRMEHVQHPAPADIKRFGKMGVVVSVQPNSVAADGSFAEKRLGKKRCETTYPFRDFLDAGVTLAFGSDGDMSPLYGIYCAVTRTTEDGKYPEGWFPHQRITVEEALRAYTYGTAYASNFEDRVGTLTVGKLADIVVLDTDILSVEPEKIKDVKVLLTIVDGEKVYMTSDVSGNW